MGHCFPKLFGSQSALSMLGFSMARILIIDDDGSIRLVLRLALQHEGHAVEVARDGAEGLERFGAGSDVDLVLLDWQMWGLEGGAVLRELKHRTSLARVVIITASDAMTLEEAKMAGARHLLRKPFTIEQLREVVETALRARPEL